MLSNVVNSVSSLKDGVNTGFDFTHSELYSGLLKSEQIDIYVMNMAIICQIFHFSYFLRNIFTRKQNLIFYSDKKSIRTLFQTHGDKRHIIMNFFK
jgi:hypothetical protein